MSDFKAKTSHYRSYVRNKLGERAFPHAGPAAWNSLPEHIRVLNLTFVF